MWSDRLRKKRLDLGFLQKDVARMLGVGLTTIKNWEVNRREPGPPYTQRITAFLEYDPNEGHDGDSRKGG